MATGFDLLRNRNVQVGIAVVALFAVILLSNQSVKAPDGSTVIVDNHSYLAAMKEATELISGPFKKDTNGEALNATDTTNLTKAAAIADSMSRYVPNGTVSYVYAGKIYRILGDTDIAILRFRQAIADLPGETTEEGKASVTEAQYELSQLLLTQHKNDEAFKLADEAVKGYPQSAVYLTARASVEAEQRNIKDANRDLDAALKLDPYYRRAQQLRKLIKDQPEIAAEKAMSRK